MSASIANDDEHERSRDLSAASELSSLISSLHLGDDTMAAAEYEDFPEEHEVSLYKLCYLPQYYNMRDCMCGHKDAISGGARNDN